MRGWGRGAILRSKENCEKTRGEFGSWVCVRYFADYPLEEVKAAGRRPGRACESPTRMGEPVTGER